MKKNLFVAAIAAATALTTGCTQNDVMQNMTENNAVAFDVYAGMSTKGLVTGNGANSTNKVGIETTGFGVYAYYTGQSDWATEGANTKPNFMFNQEVTYSSTAWTYTPTKYWPNTPGDKISFFAYAPYMTNPASGAAITEVSVPNAKDVPTVKLTLPTANHAGKMIDFVAGQMMNQEKNTGGKAVHFNLKHQTTRVSFSAKTLDDKNGAVVGGLPENTSVVITNIKFDAKDGFYSDAVYTFDTEQTDGKKDDHEQDGTWSNCNPAADFTFTDILDSKDVTIGVDGHKDGDAYKKTAAAHNCIQIKNRDAAKPLLKTGEYLFLIPPTKDGIATAGDVTVTITYDVVTEDPSLAGKHTAPATHTETIKLPAGTMAQGKAYDYTLVIGLAEVKVAVNVVAWNEVPGTEEEFPSAE